MTATAKRKKNKTKDPFCDAVDRYLLRRVALEQAKRKKEKPLGGRFYPSFISGCECDRALFYHYRGDQPTDDIDARLQRIFDNGSSMHERVQGMLHDMGILSEEDIEVRIEADSNPWKISGYIDGLVKRKKDGEITKLVLEIKSINEGGFNYCTRQDKPKKAHRLQAQVYMHLTGLKTALVYYECKNTQRHKAWIIKYNKKDVGMLLARLERTMERVEEDQIPDMCFNGAMKECQWCRYKELCKNKGGTKRVQILTIE